MHRTYREAQTQTHTHTHTHKHQEMHLTILCIKEPQRAVTLLN